MKTYSSLISLFLTVFLAASLPPTTHAAEAGKSIHDKQAVAQFATVIDDLPLMPGLTTQDDKDVLFVAGKDRIAQTTATGSVQIDDVYKFYRRTLPQLGWKPIDKRTFEREKERLRIDVTGKDPVSTTVVRFSVEPVGK